MPTTFPMRRGALIAAAASALLLGTVLHAAERAPERPELEALTSPHEARGELDALCRALLDVVIKRPASRAASLAWIQLEQRLEDSSAEVRRLARQRLQALAADAAFAGAADRDRALANRDRALALLAHLEAQAGAYEQAEALQDRRGLVRRWLVVGPFGVSPNGDHERVFPPERLGADTPLDRTRGFDERGRSRRWRPAEIAGIEDRLVPTGFLEPTDGSAYLLTHLRWRVGRRARLRITSGGSLRLWCNGVRALDVDRARAWGPRTYTVDLVPEGGWQRLLLKVSPADAAVTVTIAGVQGSPRLEVTERPALATAPGGRARLLPARAALPERPDGDDADALFATGVEWFAAGAIPDAVGLLSDALERRPGDPWIRLWLARALSRTPHLGAQRRRSEAERHWQTLQQQAPDLYPVRLHAALALKDEGKPVEAFRALAALARDIPDAIAPLREAVSLAVAHRWWREAQNMLARWRARRPANAAALVAAARVAEQRGNPHDAMALLSTAWRHDRSDRETALALLRLALAAGDTGRAQTLFASCESAWPGALEFRYQRARLALAQGDLETSCMAWEEAAERGGGMVEPWLRSAAIAAERWAQEPDSDLRARLERALARATQLAPERYELRRETAWILGAPDPDTVVRERSIPLEQVLATAPSATAFPGAATVCLLDHTISVVQSDGSRVDTVHRVWRVEAPAGIERYHTLQLPGEVLVLRTVLPDGSRWEPIRTAENAEILMPRLAPGAVIEAAYRQVLPASRQGLDTGVFFFGDPRLTEPFVRSRWELRLPRGLAWEQRRHAMPAPTVERRADRSSWLVWERRDVARRDPEPLQPPPEQIVPWARIVTPPSWDDLAELLRDGTLSGLTKPSPELERAARELGGSDLPARERLERIVRYVRDRVRRPGGERQASRVLAGGAGWRLPVIAALCRAQGLRADLVAATLGPGFASPRDPSLPFEWFRDVLLRVELPETGPVWLTNSGRLAPIGYVPRRFEGGLVLALDPTFGVTFDRIPQAAEQAHESRSHLEITLSGLDAGIVLHSTVRGLWQLKERIARTPRARLATGYVAPLLSRPFPGFELETFDFPLLEKAGAPLVLHATGRVPRWLRPRAGSERVRLPHNGFEPLPLSRHFASLDERHFPLVFTDATVRLEEVEIRLGPDWRLERLPPGDAEVTEIGTLSLSYADRGDRILVRRRLSLHPGTVDPEHYPRLREQLRRFDEAQAQRIVLRRAR